MFQDNSKYEKEYEHRGEYEYSRQQSVDFENFECELRCALPKEEKKKMQPIHYDDYYLPVGHQGYGHQQQFGRDYNQGEYEERLMRVFARYPDIDYNHMMRNERMRFEPHEIKQMEREIKMGRMPHEIFKIYEETLLNDEKTSETNQIAAKWEINPPIISSNSALFQKTNDSWQEIENGEGKVWVKMREGTTYRTNGGGLQEEWEFEYVVLAKGTSGLGLSIVGGHDNPDVGDDPSIYVTKIIDGGMAARDGRLKKEDIILRVNTTDTVDVPLHVAVDALKTAENVIKLFVKRRRARSVSPPSWNAITGNVEPIELVKRNKGLGFGIAGGIGNEHIPGDAGIFVTQIIDGGAAQLDGRLRMGDKLVAVDEHELYNVTHETAVAALKATSERVVLKIIKNPHPDLLLNASYDTPPVDASSNVDGGCRYYPPARGVTGSPAEHQTYERASLSGTYIPQIAADHTPYKSSVPLPLTSTGYQPVPRSGSPDVTRAQRTVVLQKGPAGLGFYIVGGEDGEGIYISYILPGGIADVSGSLFKGDQLIQVNDEDLRYATHEIAVQALKNSGPRVHIVAQYKPDAPNFNSHPPVPQAAAHGHQQQQQKVSPGAGGNRRPGGGALLKGGSVYRAMYDYSAADTDEVSFKEGDVILNCQSVDQGWMSGTVQRTNQWGMLHANCVEKVH